MEFGVSCATTSDGMAPGALARMVEEHGQSALFFPDHTHLPVNPETPYAYPQVPWAYPRFLELFVAMTAAAVATSRLRIGSGICLVVQRDPIITAKAVASIDQLSGGRVEFGVGAGGEFRDEMRNHGTDPRTRMALLRERVEAMQAIWAQDEASYHGEHVDFDEIWCWPKPVQRPHPPILVGGAGPTVLDRVLAFGDGWFPGYPSTTGLFDRIAELRARAERPIEVQVQAAPADPVVLDQLRDAGVRRANHFVPSNRRPAVEAALGQWERAIAELNGG